MSKGLGNSQVLDNDKPLFFRPPSFLNEKIEPFQRLHDLIDFKNKSHQVESIYSKTLLENISGLASLIFENLALDSYKFNRENIVLNSVANSKIELYNKAYHIFEDLKKLIVEIQPNFSGLKENIALLEKEKSDKITDRTSLLKGKIAYYSEKISTEKEEITQRILDLENLFNDKNYQLFFSNLFKKLYLPKEKEDQSMKTEKEENPMQQEFMYYERNLPKIKQNFLNFQNMVVRDLHQFKTLISRDFANTTKAKKEIEEDFFISPEVCKNLIEKKETEGEELLSSLSELNNNFNIHEFNKDLKESSKLFNEILISSLKYIFFSYKDNQSADANFVLDVKDFDKSILHHGKEKNFYDFLKNKIHTSAGLDSLNLNFVRTDELKMAIGGIIKALDALPEERKREILYFTLVELQEEISDNPKIKNKESILNPIKFYLDTLQQIIAKNSEIDSQKNKEFLLDITEISSRIELLLQELRKNCISKAENNNEILKQIKVETNTLQQIVAKNSQVDSKKLVSDIDEKSPTFEFLAEALWQNYISNVNKNEPQGNENSVPINYKPKKPRLLNPENENRKHNKDVKILEEYKKKYSLQGLYDINVQIWGNNQELIHHASDNREHHKKNFEALLRQKMHEGLSIKLPKEGHYIPISYTIPIDHNYIKKTMNNLESYTIENFMTFFDKFLLEKRDANKELRKSFEEITDATKKIKNFLENGYPASVCKVNVRGQEFTFCMPDSYEFGVTFAIKLQNFNDFVNKYITHELSLKAQKANADSQDAKDMFATIAPLLKQIKENGRKNIDKYHQMCIDNAFPDSIIALFGMEEIVNIEEQHFCKAESFANILNGFQTLYPEDSTHILSLIEQLRSIENNLSTFTKENDIADVYSHYNEICNIIVKSFIDLRNQNKNNLIRKEVNISNKPSLINYAFELSQLELMNTLFEKEGLFSDLLSINSKKNNSIDGIRTGLEEASNIIMKISNEHIEAMASLKRTFQKYSLNAKSTSEVIEKLNKYYRTESAEAKLWRQMQPLIISKKNEIKFKKLNKANTNQNLYTPLKDEESEPDINNLSEKLKTFKTFQILHQKMMTEEDFKRFAYNQLVSELKMMTEEELSLFIENSLTEKEDKPLKPSDLNEYKKMLNALEMNGDSNIAQFYLSCFISKYPNKTDKEIIRLICKKIEISENELLNQIDKVRNVHENFKKIKTFYSQEIFTEAKKSFENGSSKQDIINEFGKLMPNEDIEDINLFVSEIFYYYNIMKDFSFQEMLKQSTYKAFIKDSEIISYEEWKVFVYNFFTFEPARVHFNENASIRIEMKDNKFDFEYPLSSLNQNNSSEKLNKVRLSSAILSQTSQGFNTDPNKISSSNTFIKHVVNLAEVGSDYQDRTRNLTLRELPNEEKHLEFSEEVNNPNRAKVTNPFQANDNYYLK